MEEKESLLNEEEISAPKSIPQQAEGTLLDIGGGDSVNESGKIYNYY